MGRLVRWTVASIEVGVGGRTGISYILLSPCLCRPEGRNGGGRLTFVGTLLSRSCSRKGAISAEHKGHLRD
jgi:hypothetical protein